jgi:cytochrome c
LRHSPHTSALSNKGNTGPILTLGKCAPASIKAYNKGRKRADEEVDRDRHTGIGIDGNGIGAGCRKGANSFKKCLPCHSIGPRGQNKIGPELNGLDGRKAGTVPNFTYSDANKNSDLTWSEATFKQYIKDPKATVPGTKMVFVGINSEQEINDLWAYISQFDADGNIKKQ